jgi:nicotinamide-nucleotide amidase
LTSGLAVRIVAALTASGQTLATAESLTGGRVGELLTDVPGASACYDGGVISYATRLKATLAGVDPDTLAEVGPVAARTAFEMARGVAERCESDWGLATTGVAGPDPQDGHPAGQVFVAVVRRGDGEPRVRELAFRGDRRSIRSQAATGALELLSDALGLDRPQT